MDRIYELNWAYYPRTDITPSVMNDVVSAFRNNFAEINSSAHQLVSDQVLSIISAHLIERNFRVETDKKNKIQNARFSTLTHSYFSLPVSEPGANTPLRVF